MASTTDKTLPRLGTDGRDFPYFKARFESLLQRHDVEAAFPKTGNPATIDFSKEVPDAWNAPVTREVWFAARAALIEAMTPELFCTLQHTSLHGIWETLKQKFAKPEVANIFALKRQLHLINLASFGGNLKAMLDRIEALRVELSAAGSPVSDDDIVQVAFNALPPELDQVRVSLQTSHALANTKPTYAQVKALVLSEYATKSQYAAATRSTASASQSAGEQVYAASSVPPRREFRQRPLAPESRAGHAGGAAKGSFCSHCASRGLRANTHVDATCFDLHPELRGRGAPRATNPSKSTGSAQFMIAEEPDERTGNFLFTASDDIKHAFILDSGASAHMVNDVTLLYDPEEISKTIYTADKSSTLTMERRGNIRLQGEAGATIELTNVWYCPNLTCNLISEGALLAKGLATHKSSPTDVKVSFQGRTLMKGRFEGAICKLQVTPIARNGAANVAAHAEVATSTQNPKACAEPTGRAAAMPRPTVQTVIPQGKGSTASARNETQSSLYVTEAGVSEVQQEHAEMGLASEGATTRTEGTDAAQSQATNQTGSAFVSLEELWHQRLGHVNPVFIANTGKSCATHGVPILKPTLGHPCDVCSRAKMEKASFKSAPQDSSAPLELVHVDLIGKIATPSVGGKHFAVVFTDDFTSFRAVTTITHKSEYFQVFKDFKALMEKQTGRKIRKVRSDNGGEFSSNELLEYLRQEGIERQVSPPYTPQLNGTAERSNRVLIEAARSMMVQANLPTKFWGDAMAHATYIWNRVVNSKDNSRTPFEKMFGHKPTLSDVATFGCGIYVLDPTQDNKFAAKASLMVYLGTNTIYGTKRAYDLKTGKVVHCRHAAVDERSFPFQTDRSGFPDPFGAEEAPTDVQQVTATPANRRTPEQSSLKPIAPTMPQPKHPTPATSAKAPFAAKSSVQTSPKLPPPITIELSKPRTVGAPAPPAQEDQEDDEQEASDTESATDTQVPRRSARIAAQQAKSANLALVSFFTDEPRSFEEATSSPNHQEWLQAMLNELDNLTSKGTYELVNLPQGAKLVGSKWTYRAKTNENGDVVKYKARLVAQGFSQIQGLHYDETFGPVACIDSIRMVLALAAARCLPLRHVDVEGAYLWANVDKDIYMKQPKGFVDQAHPNKVWRLKKSIYGLVQSAHLWNEELTGVLKSAGLTPLSADECVFIKDGSFVVVYVDDILIAGPNEFIELVLNKLQSNFKIVDMGTPKSFIGFAVDVQETGIAICQSKYIDVLAKKFNLNESNSTHVPLPSGFDPRSESTPLADTTRYRAIIGGLNYIGLRSRPDIAHAVNTLAQFQEHPTNNLLEGAKHVLKYLITTKDLEIVYSGQGEPNFKVQAFSDANWAPAESDNTHSLSTYLITMAGNPVAWKVKKQTSVALSSAEAELHSVVMTIQQLTWMSHWLEEASLPFTVEVASDNNAAIQLLTHASGFSARTKHIKLRLAYLRETLKSYAIAVKHLPSEHMPADLLTKSFPRSRHEELVKLCGLSQGGV
jgi:hypothetical protein